jgi:hypothetical protein
MLQVKFGLSTSGKAYSQYIVTVISLLQSILTTCWGKFSPEDMKAFTPNEKVGLLA